MLVLIPFGFCLGLFLLVIGVLISKQLRDIKEREKKLKDKEEHIKEVSTDEEK